MIYLVFDKDGELYDVLEFESDKQLEDFKAKNSELSVKSPNFIEGLELEDEEDFYED